MKKLVIAVIAALMSLSANFIMMGDRVNLQGYSTGMRAGDTRGKDIGQFCAHPSFIRG